MKKVIYLLSLAVITLLACEKEEYIIKESTTDTLIYIEKDTLLNIDSIYSYDTLFIFNLDTLVVYMKDTTVVKPAKKEYKYYIIAETKDIAVLVSDNFRILHKNDTLSIDTIFGFPVYDLGIWDIAIDTITVDNFKYSKYIKY